VTFRRAAPSAGIVKQTGSFGTVLIAALALGAGCADDEPLRWARGTCLARGRGPGQRTFLAVLGRGADVWAGGDPGLFFHCDGSGCAEVESSQRVRGLAHDGAHLYAATGGGVFRLLDR
jgi:hypothetical protein